MKQQQHGNGAPASAQQEPKPSEPSPEEPERADGSWGKGAATALERLRRNDYRGHPGKPDRDRPDPD